eukprot:c21450_g6_i5.p1 GENE.c21450_g6_i5~~c21450_g6_i5.p1  ORF type:complete len:453 (+),score=143.33 c21450_g6_i5:498-1856(+)
MEQLILPLIQGPNDFINPNPQVRLHPLRWFILFVFSFSSFNQYMIWITFSPISDLTQQYYGISDTEVQFFLIWGGIMFILFAIPMLLFSRLGLRTLILVTVSLQLICCLLRCIPCLFESQFVRSHGAKNDFGIAFVHIGQILNAICGPLVMASPSQVSQTWFGENERTLATAIGTLANNLGAAIGFLLGPFLVQEGHPDSIPNLLYAHSVFAAIPFVLAIIYFPSHPPNPPSIAALKSIESNNPNISAKKLLKSVVLDMKKCLQNKDLLLTLPGGVYAGVFNGWSGVISSIIKPLNYTNNDAGWLGFGATIGAILGGLLAGYIADKYFQKRFKNLLVIFLVFGSLFFMWFALSIPSPFWSEELLPQSFLTLLIAVTGAGFFLGCTNPLFIEFGVELTYPIPETASTVLITLCNNIGTMSFLFIPPEKNQVMTATMFIIVVITTIINMVAVIT